MKCLHFGRRKRAVRSFFFCLSTFFSSLNGFHCEQTGMGAEWRGVGGVAIRRLTGGSGVNTGRVSYCPKQGFSATHSGCHSLRIISLVFLTGFKVMAQYTQSTGNDLYTRLGHKSSRRSTDWIHITFRSTERYTHFRFSGLVYSLSFYWCVELVSHVTPEHSGLELKSVPSDYGTFFISSGNASLRGVRECVCVKLASVWEETLLSSLVDVDVVPQELKRELVWSQCSWSLQSSEDLFCNILVYNNGTK